MVKKNTFSLLLSASKNRLQMNNFKIVGKNHPISRAFNMKIEINKLI